MIRIEPNCLYSRADLAAMLEPAGVDVDHFIARLRPRKVFKQLYYGADLLKALDAAPALADRPEGVDFPPATNRGNRRRRCTVEAVYPGSKLDAYARKLKEGRS